MTKSRKDLAREATRKYVSLLADFTIPIAAEKLLERVICSYLPVWPNEAEVTEIVKMNGNQFAAGFSSGIAHCKRRHQLTISMGPDLTDNDE